jgi:hypothetical protein
VSNGAPGVVFATADAWVTSSVLTRRGEMWDASDAVVAENPGAFTPDPDALGLVRRSSSPMPPAQAALAAFGADLAAQGAAELSGRPAPALTRAVTRFRRPGGTDR